MRLAIVVALAACGGPRFLGETLPAECRSSYGHCDGELELRSWRDGYLAPDRKLDAYVAQVEARIARVSSLASVPEVVVVPTGAAAVVGNTIVIGRSTIVALGSEAELAAILAHETAHLEQHLDETGYLGYPVDEEAIADERGVALLARAGYPPLAMATALHRILVEEDDPLHPPADLRVRRTTLLAGDDHRPDSTRPALLAAIDGAIVGYELERGLRVGDAWIDADRDIAVRLPAGMTFEKSDTDVIAWAHDARYGAWRLGPRLGRELVERLVVHEHFELPIGRVTIVTARPHDRRFTSSLDRMIADRRSSMGTVDGDEVGAVVESRRGAMLFTISDRDVATLKTWLAMQRLPTPAERAAAVSPRLTLVRATKTGTVRELVAACIDPAAALDLDDPDRVIAAGEPLKCTDRKRPTSTSPAPPSSPPTP